MSTLPPDALLTQRVQKALAERDRVRDVEIQMRTAARIARQQADSIQEQVKLDFGVHSLEELQAKASKTYADNLAQVVAFEESVKEYVTNVNAASKIVESPKA